MFTGLGIINMLQIVFITGKSLALSLNTDTGMVKIETPLYLYLYNSAVTHIYFLIIKKRILLLNLRLVRLSKGQKSPVGIVNSTSKDRVGLLEPPAEADYEFFSSKMKISCCGTFGEVAAKYQYIQKSQYLNIIFKVNINSLFIVLSQKTTKNLHSKIRLLLLNIKSY